MFPEKKALTVFLNHDLCYNLQNSRRRRCRVNIRKTTAEIFNPDELPKEILQELKNTAGSVCRSGGKLYVLTDGKVFCCNDDPAGNELFSRLTGNPPGKDKKPGSREELYRRILTDQGYVPDPETLKQYRLQPNRQGCAVIYRSVTGQEKDLFDLLRQMIPLEKKDILIPAGFRNAAFIREDDPIVPEELREYTEAVIGSMESEGITGIKAGIGREADNAENLRNSYRDAVNALFIGSVYHRQDSVYIYNRQVLERIVDSIPAETKKEIRKEYCQLNMPDSLSDEMLETVRVFFRNDLKFLVRNSSAFVGYLQNKEIVLKKAPDSYVSIRVLIRI